METAQDMCLRLLRLPGGGDGWPEGMKLHVARRVGARTGRRGATAWPCLPRTCHPDTRVNSSTSTFSSLPTSPAIFFSSVATEEVQKV